jgi:hypothetical protein
MVLQEIPGFADVPFWDILRSFPEILFSSGGNGNSATTVLFECELEARLEVLTNILKSFG